MAYQDHQITQHLEAKRRLLLQKDLFELLHWMSDLEHLHTELTQLSIIEKQLLKKTSIALNIQGLRRNNTLLMAMLCKYEQLIKTEIEYAKTDYDLKRSKEHEKQRAQYMGVIKEYRLLKADIFNRLCQFSRRTS